MRDNEPADYCIRNEREYINQYKDDALPHLKMLTKVKNTFMPSQIVPRISSMIPGTRIQPRLFFGSPEGAS
jgi:hypothetical protein